MRLLVLFMAPNMITSGAAGGTSAPRRYHPYSSGGEKHSSQDFCTKALPVSQGFNLPPFVRHKASKPPTSGSEGGSHNSHYRICSSFGGFRQLRLPCRTGAKQLCRVASIFKVQRRKSVQFAVVFEPGITLSAAPLSRRRSATLGKARQGKARQGKGHWARQRQPSPRAAAAMQPLCPCPSSSLPLLLPAPPRATIAAFSSQHAA